MGPLCLKKWKDAILKMAACRIAYQHFLGGECVFGVKPQTVIGPPTKKIEKNGKIKDLTII